MRPVRDGVTDKISFDKPRGGPPSGLLESARMRPEPRRGSPDAARLPHRSYASVGARDRSRPSPSSGRWAPPWTGSESSTPPPDRPKTERRRERVPAASLGLSGSTAVVDHPVPAVEAAGRDRVTRADVHHQQRLGMTERAAVI